MQGRKEVAAYSKNGKPILHKFFFSVLHDINVSEKLKEEKLHEYLQAVNSFEVSLQVGFSLQEEKTCKFRSGEEYLLADFLFHMQIDKRWISQKLSGKLKA